MIVVIAIASGVALAVTAAVVRSSTTASFTAYAKSFSGPAPIRVVGPVDRGGIKEAMIARIAHVDGVAEAAPLIQAVTVVDTEEGDDIPVVAIGYDCSITALVGAFACDPTAIASARSYRAPLTSISLAQQLGREGVIRTNDGPKPAAGAVGIEALEQVNGGRVVAFPIHVAQTLFTRPGAYDAVYVIPERGVEPGEVKTRLERTLPDQLIVLRSEETSPWFQFFAQLYVLLGVVGIGTLATGAVLAHNALALSLEDRRRDLAVAAAIGASPRTIFAGALAEGAVLGIAGGLLGAGVGVLVSYPVLSSFQWFSERWAGLSMSVHVTASPFVTGAVLGGAVGVIAALRPARQASRADVVTQLQGRSPPPDPARRTIARTVVIVAIGITGAVGARLAARDLGIEPWQPAVVQIAAGVGVVAFILAITQLAPWAFAAGSRLVRGRSAPARVAWANLVGEGPRSASMVLAAASAVFAGAMIANLGTTVLDSLAAEVGRVSNGSLIVATTPISNSLNLDAKPSPQLVDAIRSFPGVERVDRLLGLGVAGPSGVTLVEGLDHPAQYEVIRGRIDAQAYARGEILVGPGIARRDGVRPGQTLRLPGRDGFVDIPVQAVVANGDSTGLEVTMPIALAERLWGGPQSGTLNVIPKVGVDPEDLARRIESADLDPYLNALAPDELVDAVSEDNARFFVPFWALQRALVAIAFAAVLSNLLLIALRRRRELGLVSAVGMSPRSLASMVVIEAVAVGIVAVVLGSLAALGATEAFLHALHVMIPYPMSLRVDIAAPFLYGAITLAVLVVAAALPAWRTARLDVVDALRLE